MSEEKSFNSDGKSERVSCLSTFVGKLCPVNRAVMPRVIHCILHNLVSEQRLHKMALSTLAVCETEVVGIISPGNSPSIGERPYHVRRLWVPFQGGPLFFLSANIRLFIYLFLRRSWDAVIANDLAALPAAWLAATLRRKALLLDSRELFTQTPFLVHRPLVRRIWEVMERFLYPRVDYIVTVSPPIAEYFRRKYGKPVWLVYNLPLRKEGFVSPRLENRLLIYQGMLHPYRGLEELILAFSYVDEWKLWIVGDGPLRGYLEKLVRQQGLEERVKFFGMVPFEVVDGYTRQATMGVSAELPQGLNHKYALPNKLFDYIQLGIPVLAGEAELVQRIVRHYHCGMVVESWEPRSIARALRFVASQPDLYAGWVKGARSAAKVLHWEQQESCIQVWLRTALQRQPLSVQSIEPACQGIQHLSEVLQGA
ncbi:MAG: glycosyltransferase [Bacteroidia bacterium]|nr:glycosyltransferase [Bacteroidia bacterium]MDW8417537.1 glycosyltransferase [Bacteroidia bacterium]